MRVYIIDEVHMLSISAFNALLKIIEEPPEHLLFILATTELHKVPATILSRCQRFSFRRISQDDIAARLQYVAYQENIELEDAAARVLARLADGGMRDALSLLDQCASATTGDLTAEKVYGCLGIAGVQECGKLMAHIAAHDAQKALSLLNRFYAEGKDMAALMDEMACLTRDFMIMKTAPKEGINMLSGVSSDSEVRELAVKFSEGELVRMLGLIQQTSAGFTRSASRRLDAELCILNLCQPELSLDAEAMNARLSRLEEQIKQGTFVAQETPIQEAAPIQENAVSEHIKVDPLPVRENLEDEAPIGFWTDIAAEIRRELKPPVSGFFTNAQNAPVQGVLKGSRLVLLCANPFTMEVVNKPEIIHLIARKASAKLNAQIQVTVVDQTSGATKSEQMEQLLQFGRAHSDIIKIKEN